MAKMNWNRPSQPHLGTGMSSARAAANRILERDKARGISNEQAKTLAALQRLAGERYSGSGMTAAQAAREIKRLKCLHSPTP